MTVLQSIQAPTRTPNRYGLFSVVDFGTAERGSAFLSWDSIGCTPLNVVEDECILGAAPGGPLVPDVDCENTGGTTGFSVVAFDDSSLGRPPRNGDDAGRAAAKLALYEQFAAEVMLTGVIGSVAVAPGVVTDSPVAAIGEVETELETEGVILVRRSFVALLPDYFVQTGSMLRTRLGTPVAACSGWDSLLAPTDVLGVHSLVGFRNAVESRTGWGSEALAINDRADVATRDYAFGWDCEALKAPGA